MTRGRGFAGGLVLAAAELTAGCASHPAATEIANEPPPSPATCRFDVRDAPLKDVLDHLVNVSGRGFVVDDALAGERVTLKVVDLPWPAALEVLGERVDADVDITKHTIAVSRPSTEELKARRWPASGLIPWRPWSTESVENPTSISLSRPAGPLREVIAEIARVAEVDIVTHSEIGDSRLKVGLVDVPWPRALEAVVKTKGGVIVDHGSVLVVRRWPPGPVDALAGLLRECEMRGREVRRAIGSGDAAWTKAARRAFRWRIELFEEQFAEHSRGLKTADTQARWKAEVETPRTLLLGEFADLFQEP